MLLIFPTFKGQESLQAEVNSLAQVKDFLANTHPDLYARIKDRNLVYGLLHSEDKYQAVTIRPEMIATTFENYDILLISDKIEGEFVFSSIAAAITASILGAVGFASITAGIVTAATIAGYLGAGLIMMGIAFGIGQLLQMLAPNQKVGGDPSGSLKNYMFNGIPNIKEQGGSVPLVFGNCLFGGVLIAISLTTIDTDVSGSIDLDNNVKRINFSDLNTIGGSGWRRIK